MNQKCTGYARGSVGARASRDPGGDSVQAVAAIRDGLVRRRWYAAAGAFSTIAATIRSRELVKVSYDGK